MKTAQSAFLICSLIQFCVADLCSYNFTLQDLPRSLLAETTQLLIGGMINAFTSCNLVSYRREKTKLLLYTRDRADYPIKLSSYNTEQLYGRSTIVLVHGFLCNPTNDLIPELKNAYLEKYDRNVIVIDWSYYSGRYYSSCYCILPRIAKEIATFLCEADEKGDNDISQMHFVGHSMGAQLSGLVGQEVKSNCGKTLGRISGLDPAGPLYIGASESERLDASDATTVMVIHTNKGTLGYSGNCGTVDFYPNGGAHQTGCTIQSAPVSGIVNQAIYPIVCSHLRAVDYMIESIYWNKFIGKSCIFCSSCIANPFSQTFAVMGEDVEADKVPCSYYLDTNDKSPYAITGSSYE